MAELEFTFNFYGCFFGQRNNNSAHFRFSLSLDNELKWRPSYQRTPRFPCNPRKSEVCARTHRAALVDAVQADRRISGKTETPSSGRTGNGGRYHVEEKTAEE